MWLLHKISKLTEVHEMAEFEKKTHEPLPPACRYLNTCPEFCWHEVCHTCFVEQWTPVEHRDKLYVRGSILTPRVRILLTDSSLPWYLVRIPGTSFCACASVCAYVGDNTYGRHMHANSGFSCPRRVQATNFDFLGIENFVKLDQTSPVALVELWNISGFMSQLAMLGHVSQYYGKIAL